MPQIFDNIERRLVDGLTAVMAQAEQASFCIGYFNLRGWNELADVVDGLQAKEGACRILIGMHRPPDEEARLLAGLRGEETGPDGPTAALLRKRFTETFHKQLQWGIPTNQAREALRRLASQLRIGRVRLKAFLRYPLHAKLYLIRRQDAAAPLIGFVGSSNLTLAGISLQGELNVDVVEQDAAEKLQRWFEERWNDEQAVELSSTLADLIEKSWACLEDVRPYLIYLKIAYHLCEEARQGEKELKLPKPFQNVLLDFQAAAVALVVKRLNKLGGVLLGDVVGLGKTLMAAAVARILQEDNDSWSTLVICPPKLKPMWDTVLQEYEITGKVLSLGRVDRELRDLRRYRLVIIDESHNLRNREGVRYRAIKEYIEENESKALLLTATPYNKQFLDLSNQLRLFIDENKSLHVRPERFFRLWAEQGRDEADFVARFQAPSDSLRAFEESLFPEDWQDLMRLFLVRRTRQFILQNYAQFDQERRRYFVMMQNKRFYFPVRRPLSITFPVEPDDLYGRLLQESVVEEIERLKLPRYGMAGYLVTDAEARADTKQKTVIANLNRAGRRLIGFCRTNLFKRLESSGYSFMLSVERHITRNLVTLYALQNRLPVPIGTQDAALLDPALNDSDEEFAEPDVETGETTLPEPTPEVGKRETPAAAFRGHAEQVYRRYSKDLKKRFDWLDSEFFRPELMHDLQADVDALLRILEKAGNWEVDRDAKLCKLESLLRQIHPQKALVFTQFADTALYLKEELCRRGLTNLACVTSDEGDPVALARRFSPHSNGGLKNGESELRILIATDVLAEGQNLQDAHILINYDLPWAIIRLIQRAGRVDRIGQQHDTITVYSFLPADGVERIIRLRRRLLERLTQNQEVIGADESFFGEEAAQKLRDLYTERAGVLDDDEDQDIDLASLALQVWNSASAADQKAAAELPPIVAGARHLGDGTAGLPGAVTYLKFPDGADALVRVDEKGDLISQSLAAIFRDIACAPDEPPAPLYEGHDRLVELCARKAAEEQVKPEGKLGSMRSVRRRLYERLDQMRKNWQRQREDQLRKLDAVNALIDLIWRFPLTSAAQEAIRRQMRLGISDDDLIELLQKRMEDENLCRIMEEEAAAEPQIICSLGLRPKKQRSDA